MSGDRARVVVSQTELILGLRLRVLEDRLHRTHESPLLHDESIGHATPTEKYLWDLRLRAEECVDTNSTRAAGSTTSPEKEGLMPFNRPWTAIAKELGADQPFMYYLDYIAFERWLEGFVDNDQLPQSRPSPQYKTALDDYYRQKREMLYNRLQEAFRGFYGTDSLPWKSTWKSPLQDQVPRPDWCDLEPPF